MLEANLIKKYKPIYNIRLSDDKFFPFVKISRDRIPYVSITRKRDDKNVTYFGPYTNSTDLKIVLRLLRKIFPFQSVKNHPKKRCFYSHLHLCPCATFLEGNVTECKKNIKNLTSFLRGNKEKVVGSLKKDQRFYIRLEEFEKAAEIQRKIEKIDRITSENYEPFRYEEKPDFYFERIKNELASLIEILNKYGLKINSLHRIECYDVSNISGKHATGSMVVFIEGEAYKNDYRRFKIKFKKTPDDFAMLQEVMQRRIKRDDWEKPNLMVIDGGKGQISSVLQVFTEQKFEVPVIGLAKLEETIIVPIRPVRQAQGKPGSRLDFIEVKLPHSTPGVNLLRRIRDEAHRFAISYHRMLRRKALNI